MTHRHLATLLLSVAILLPAAAQEKEESKDLMELQVIASSREEGLMRQQPASVSMVGERQLKEVNATSLKDVSTLVPNFFMPDYGSRQSSGVYIRGIGSRINSPAIGLYIDDVPVLDKSSFDLGLYDLQRVDVLRGPQSTLYGTGTMGGVMKVYTRNPFTYQGTDLSAGYATRDNTRTFSFMHYAKEGKRFAWAFGGSYHSGDGFFKNMLTGQKVDNTEGGGLRVRGVWETGSGWMLDFGTNLEIDTDGAYPYIYKGRADGQAEDNPDLLHHISNNQRGLYERFVTRSSVNASKKFETFELRSITSLQSLRDSMQMDQDFLSADIYKLTQRQKNLTFTEDVLLKSRKPGRWQWISGAVFSMLRSHTKAPVTFFEDGVQMLNTMIDQGSNANMPAVSAGPMTMHFNLTDQIQGKELLFDNKFTTRNYNAGIFHQSTFRHLFHVRGLSATVGLRLNVESQRLKYAAWYDFHHNYQLQGKLTMPNMERDVQMVPETDFHVRNGLYSQHYAGQANAEIRPTDVKDTYLQLMPRVALQYDIENAGNVYATISRGYRTGGYNLQNISELMRSLMMRDMMQNVRDVTLPVLNAQPTVPAETKELVAGILNAKADLPAPDVKATCTFKPEYAWNYELGAHLNLLEGRLGVDASAFLSDIRDMQLSQMSETGMGRIMVNAGKSRSAGVELNLKARPANGLLTQLGYGYTHATFQQYFDYDATSKKLVDCKGNYVPFMPLHTLNVDASYDIDLHPRLPRRYNPRRAFIPTSVTVGANYSGAGKIYWTEQNDAVQDYYSLLSARATLNMAPLTITVWGRNLTGTHYNTFWFVSASRTYEQHGKPLQVGLDLNFRF